MHLRRISKPAILLCIGTLAGALGAGPALAGGDDPPEDGLIVADDLSGDWDEGPPDEDDDDSLDDAAAEIEACAGIIEIQEEVDDAPKVEGSTFTLDGEQIKSGVAVVSKRAAKRAVKAYRSDGSDCFEELLSASAPTTNYEVGTQSGPGPDAGDGSAFITAVITGEDESTGEPFELVFQLVIVRAGGTIAVYEYEAQADDDGGSGGEDFTDAVEAAGERLAEAV